jgi:DNA polymerase-3 subunit epsilon
MKLKLTKPIVFFDIEATGLDIAKDRIIEISILKIFEDQHEESYTYRINPECHIPETSTKIHGITDKDVKDCPTFKNLSKTISKIIEGCDIGGFNSNRFDIPLLAEEFLRCDNDIDLRRCHFIDVQTIFHKMEKRTLEAAYSFYCNKELINAHSALADAKATYEVLQAQLDRYPSLENNVATLSEFSSQNRNVDYSGRMIYNEKDEPIFNFGKFKGKRVADVLKIEPNYYAWVMNNDFPLDTKRQLTNIKLKMK